MVLGEGSLYSGIEFGRSRTSEGSSKILLFNGNFILALARWWLLLWAWLRCGGSGWAPGWCGWAVLSVLRPQQRRQQRQVVAVGGLFADGRPSVFHCSLSLLVRWGDAWPRQRGGAVAVG
jgi:hypothetical protein